MSFWYSRFFSQDLESDLEALIGIAPDLDGQGLALWYFLDVAAVVWLRVSLLLGFTSFKISRPVNIVCTPFQLQQMQ